ncbi:MAG: protealysin inhibitor emfourin [Pyrinomonadaceae bacterium]
MRINFKRSGGFAALPALSRPVVIDTDELPHDKAQEVKGLVAAARAADHPTPGDGGQSRDAYNYTVEIEDGGAKHVIQTQDGNVPPPLQPLINWLSRAHDEAIRGGAAKTDAPKA